jgi:hypothetical protein
MGNTDWDRCGRVSRTARHALHVTGIVHTLGLLLWQATNDLAAPVVMAGRALVPWGESAMKFSVDIDCTPEEARSFLGLPDVKPMQEAMATAVHERLKAAASTMEPEALMKMWLPGGAEGMEQLQKMFWAGLSPRGRADE